MADERSGLAAGLGGLGLLLGVGLVISAIVVSSAAREIKREGQTLEVKGYAEKHIASDWSVWRATFTTRGATLPEAYALLERHREALVAFLAAEQVPESEYELMPVSTQALYRRDARGHYTNELDGYRLAQEVRLGSSDLDRVVRVSKGSSELVKQGVELSPGSPEFFYTRLGELKIEMLAEATSDAHRRAEVLAEGSGSRLGRLRSARQGVFQITPAHSTEVSDYGRNDTTSREKAIKAVVTMQYSIEND
jgi:hypothetical protein